MHALAPSSATCENGAFQHVTGEPACVADLCTFEGFDNRGNYVAADSLCDGSWVGNSTSCPYYAPDCQTQLHLAGRGITGTLPTELGLLMQLTMLNVEGGSFYLLEGTYISGVVPSQLGLLSNVDAL